MTNFIVIFIAMFCCVLVLAPFTWRTLRENDTMREELRGHQQEISLLLRDMHQYRLASEQASDGIIVQDMSGRIVWANSAYCDMHKREKDDILGRNPLEFAVPDDIAPSPEEIRDKPFDITEGQLHRFLNQNGEGGLFWIELSASFHQTVDGKRFAIVVSRDVSEKVHQERQLREVRDQLRHEATHDGLTGLANRAALMSYLSDVKDKKEGDSLGLLHIDLDNFKDINDTHGHSAGDAVLQKLATTLVDVMPPSCLVSRIGGDEFVVACSGVHNLHQLRGRAAEVKDAVTLTFEWSGRVLQSEASIGAALSRTKDFDIEDLLLQSDFALYEAKRKGRNAIALYDKRLHQKHAEDIQRAHDVKEAIKTNAFHYVFQPKLDLNTGEISGIETLIRWTHPELGFMSPADFLPMADHLGLMGELDLLSMEAALAFKARLNDLGYTALSVAFNASPDLLAHPDFFNRLSFGVEAAQIARDSIVVEVLENTEFGEPDDSNTNAGTICKLKDAGFKVHLDDFGIGIAGLSHLARLSVTGVKIDQGLVTNMLADTTSLKIVQGIIDLSRNLGLEVVAEGIEDMATANALRTMGCPEIQGYWLSRPLGADDLEYWLLGRSQSPASARA